MIRLRDGAAADVAALFALDQLCFSAGIAYPADEFRRLLRSRRRTCLVAEDDAVLAGFVIVQDAVAGGRRGGHIITLDVSPHFRRRGVGRLLMAQVEERLRAAGAEWLRLEVAENNPGAYSFYLGLGFAPVGKVRNYYLGKIHATVMAKSLIPPGLDATEAG